MSTLRFQLATTTRSLGILVALYISVTYFSLVKYVGCQEQTQIQQSVGERLRLAFPEKNSKEIQSLLEVYNILPNNVKRLLDNLPISSLQHSIGSEEDINKSLDMLVTLGILKDTNSQLKEKIHTIISGNRSVDLAQTVESNSEPAYSALFDTNLQDNSNQNVIVSTEPILDTNDHSTVVETAVGSLQNILNRAQSTAVGASQHIVTGLRGALSEIRNDLSLTELPTIQKRNLQPVISDMLRPFYNYLSPFYNGETATDPSTNPDIYFDEAQSGLNDTDNHEFRQDELDHENGAGIVYNNIPAENADESAFLDHSEEDHINWFNSDDSLTPHDEAISRDGNNPIEMLELVAFVMNATPESFYEKLNSMPSQQVENIMSLMSSMLPRRIFAPLVKHSPNPLKLAKAMAHDPDLFLERLGQLSPKEAQTMLDDTQAYIQKQYYN